MIVECEKIYNENTKKYMDTHSMLTIGRKYIVLEMEYHYDIVYYRLIPDDGGFYGHPILVRIEDFKVISGKIPKNWNLNRVNKHASVLGPEKWSNHECWEEDFWEDWDNGSKKALECFEEEYKIIREADNLKTDDRFR